MFKVHKKETTRPSNDVIALLLTLNRIHTSFCCLQMKCKCPLQQKVDKSNLTKPQIKKKTANIDFNKNPIREIYVYFIRENFCRRKVTNVSENISTFPRKVLLNKVFIFAVGEQVEFCQDKFL